MSDLSPSKKFLEVSHARQRYVTSSPGPGLSNDNKHVFRKSTEKKFARPEDSVNALKSMKKLLFFVLKN